MFFSREGRYNGKQIGEYRIIDCIGQGRYGVCFLAESRNERVILKQLKKHLFKRNNDKAFWETKILSELCHSGIPRLIDSVNEKDFYGFVLEEKPGDTVEAVLFKKKHSFTKAEVFNIGKQLIGIIRYLHNKGIVHRDIRIPNVILNGSEVYLVDFGLSRWVDNKRYTKDIDFSYLGDFLLYLLYSSYIKTYRAKRPWYEELSLTSGEKLFLKRLLRLEESYNNIEEIASDFEKIFGSRTLPGESGKVEINPAF